MTTTISQEEKQEINYHLEKITQIVTRATTSRGAELELSDFLEEKFGPLTGYNELAATLGHYQQTPLFN